MLCVPHIRERSLDEHDDRATEEAGEETTGCQSREVRAESGSYLESS